MATLVYKLLYSTTNAYPERSAIRAYSLAVHLLFWQTEDMSTGFEASLRADISPKSDPNDPFPEIASETSFRNKKRILT